MHCRLAHIGTEHHLDDRWEDHWGLREWDISHVRIQDIQYWSGKHAYKSELRWNRMAHCLRDRTPWIQGSSEFELYAITRDVELEKSSTRRKRLVALTRRGATHAEVRVDRLHCTSSLLVHKKVTKATQAIYDWVMLRRICFAIIAELTLAVWIDIADLVRCKPRTAKSRPPRRRSDHPVLEQRLEPVTHTWWI